MPAGRYFALSLNLAELLNLWNRYAPPYEELEQAARAVAHDMRPTGAGIEYPVTVSDGALLAAGMWPMLVQPPERWLTTDMDHCSICEVRINAAGPYA